MNTPCKIKWTGPQASLVSPQSGETLYTVMPGSEGILVYPGLASFHPDLALLYRVEDGHYSLSSEDSSDGDLGGWDGKTVTAALLKQLLDLEEAIPTLVKVMNDNPDLGPKVVQGVMAGMT